MALRVLLVEDSAAYAQLVRAALSVADVAFDVTTATSLKDALAALDDAEADVDVILLDLGLPDSFGLETYAGVRDRTPETPVVVLTGNDDTGVGVEAVKLGAQDYLIKGRGDRESVARALAYAVERGRIAKARSELFATISHEFRNPLTAIMLSADTLGQPGFPVADREAFTEVVGVIKEQAQSLLVHVNELLDLTRLSAGALDLEARPVTVGDAVGEAVSVVEPQARDGGLSMGVEVPAGLPSVLADPQRLRQVLVNLLSNAVKYTATGGAVQLRAEAGHGLVTVHVSDTGQGIPEQDQPHVFEPYFRAKGVIAQHGRASTGLGLALVRRLVNAQGGEVWLTSEQGKGSTFSFTLPVAG